MNILVDPLPDRVNVNGQICRVNTDFRVCLTIILAFEDPELVDVEKQILMLSTLYLDPPEDVQRAVEQGVRFLNCGKEHEENNGPRLYSFAKDGELIFSAFKQTHGIDLESAEGLHWWKFMALFMDLGADTAFCNLVGLRKQVFTGKASKEERAAAREMGSIFDVPDTEDRTIEELELERLFLSSLGGK